MMIYFTKFRYYVYDKLVFLRYVFKQISKPFRGNFTDKLCEEICDKFVKNIEPCYDSKGNSLHHLKMSMLITSNITFKSFLGLTLLISGGQDRTQN